jgi:uncharacterized protein HemX
MALYGEFLLQATDSLRFFEQSNYQVSGFKEQLSQLKKIDVSKNYPGRLASSLAIEDRLKERLNTPITRIEGIE